MESLKHEKIRRLLKPEAKYRVQNRALCFMSGNRQPEETAGGGLLGKIQDCLKKSGRVYYYLLKVLGPVLVHSELRKRLKQELAGCGAEHAILNLGSGPQVLENRDDIINVDIFAFDNVDMVADGCKLPLEDNSVDLVINMAMLEHVPEPELVVREMLRVIKPGGKVLCYLPFIVPFHAAPHDFYRWTRSGARELFRDFDRVEVGIGAGPTSGMVYVLLEWLSLVLSFGSQKLRDLMFLVLMVLSAPLKILDMLLVKYPGADKAASGFYVAGSKL